MAMTTIDLAFAVPLLFFLVGLAFVLSPGRVREWTDPNLPRGNLPFRRTLIAHRLGGMVLILMALILLYTRLRPDP